MELKEEWKKVLHESTAFYIYGAGKIGKKIYSLVEKENQLNKLLGFVVTALQKGDLDNINGKPVLEIDSLNEKDSVILVSVSDIYQNEILELLQNRGFSKVVCAYKYSFLDEKEIPNQIPDSIMIDLRELLVQQYHTIPYHTMASFNRYDIIVRLLAIENYYEENDYGFGLYKKMQGARIRKGYAQTAEERFRALIRSFADNGYKEDSEIIVDRNLKLIDGAHRIALAIYHGISRVKIGILERDAGVDYGLGWFEQHFDSEECNVLTEYEKRLSKEWSVPIKGILWPTVSPYFEEITKLIEEQYKVINVADHLFPKEIFERFVHGVYHVDDIAEWKIRYKLEHFGDMERYPVRIIDIDMKTPDFRIKSTGTTISRNGEKLKRKIREGYKEKIDDYIQDNVFHTADNFYQSEYISALTAKAFSLRGMLRRLSDLDWMLIKTENDYFPENFPEDFPLFKDIDMVCRREEADAILERVIGFYKECESGKYNTKVMLKKDKGFKVRFELDGFLIFQVDVLYSNDYLQETFIRDSLLRKKTMDGYFAAGRMDEILYRMVDVCEHPQKKRHLVYVKDCIERMLQ